MGYMESLGSLNYTFTYENEDGVEKIETIDLVDILRLVSFTKEAKENENNYTNYTLVDEETPDDVAYKLYGDPSKFWVLLLFNDIIDVHNEWLISSYSLKKKEENFYDGNSYFVHESLDANPGDLVIKRVDTDEADTENYGFIDSYDPIFHRFDIKKIKGTLSLNDEVFVLREIQSDVGTYFKIDGVGLTACTPSHAGLPAGGTYCNDYPVQDPNEDGEYAAPLCMAVGSDYTIIRKKVDKILDAPYQFRYNGEELDPYAGVASVDGDVVTFSQDVNGNQGSFYSPDNICGYTSSVLYKYINNSLPDPIKIRSRKEEFLYQNDLKRVIKVLNPNIANLAQKEFMSILKDRSLQRGIRKTISIN
jgi:hypothetical protein